MKTTKSRDTIQSLSTGISILDAFMEKKRPLRIVEIQEMTDITKSNLYKYLNTLMNDQLIFRDEETGLYHLGPRLIQYGLAAIDNQDVVQLATPYLHAVAEETNNTALFVTPTVNGPIVTKIIRSQQILNIGAEMGTLLPPRSSTGKIFQVFSEDYKTKGWRTEYESELLNDDSEEVKIIREEKIAFAAEPLISDISSVSIPILNSLNELIGIIVAVGFSQLIPTDIKDERATYYIELQRAISKNLY